MKLKTKLTALFVAVLTIMASLPFGSIASAADTAQKTLPTPTDVKLLKSGDKVTLQWNSHRNEFTDYGDNANDYYWAVDVKFYSTNEDSVFGTSGDESWYADQIETGKATLDVSKFFVTAEDGPYYAAVSMEEFYFQKFGENQWNAVSTGVKSATVESNEIWVGKNKSEIADVKINNVRTPMFEGETPKFTAQEYLFDENYEIECEYWEEVENGEPVAAVYSDGRDPKPLKKIETFEAGKEYVYNVTIKAKKFYHFSDSVTLTVNGENKTNASVKPMGVDKNYIYAAAVMSAKPVTIKEISEVRVNNVTTSFKTGDKPKFTATVPSGVQYDISFEGWDTTDSKGNNYGISTSEFWNNRYDGKLIKTFTGGQKYTYQVVVILKSGAYEQGYRFAENTKLYLNSKLVTFKNANDAQWDDGYSMWYNNVTSFTPAACQHKFKTTVKKATTSKNGKITKTCTACKKTISTATIYKASKVTLSTTKYTYNGKVKTPTVTVKTSKGKTLKKNTDYTVSYAKGRKYVGKYSVKITFKGNYTGTKTLYFTINPKGTSLKSVKAGKKSFTAKWSAQKSQTSGYQVRYSTAKSFKGAKTATISKNKTTSKTVKKLKAKKKYYVRVRTYKTVGKTKYYSGWSDYKTVKPKK